MRQAKQQAPLCIGTHTAAELQAKKRFPEYYMQYTQGQKAERRLYRIRAQN